MSSVIARVSVVGAVSSGKSTLAGEIARRLAAPHIELDLLRYRPGWIPVSSEEFCHSVAVEVGRDRWVLDGNYAEVLDLIWIRAQLVVWLDFPLQIVLWRLFRRTADRLLNSRRVSIGKREKLGRLLGSNSIFVWAVRSHQERRTQFERFLKTPRYGHLKVVRLRSPSEVEAWLSLVNGNF